MHNEDEKTDLRRAVSNNLFMFQPTNVSYIDIFYYVYYICVSNGAALV